MSGPRTLIVGADGEIGAALARHLKARDWPVVPTSRRGTPGALQMDLAGNPKNWPELPKVETAVLCAAFSNIAACARDPAGAAAVNVAGIDMLAQRLAGQGTQVLFLSSNQVFDGAKPRRPRDDRPDPVSEYGRQKVWGETTVLALGDRGAVLRLTKVMTPALKLLQDWRIALAKGEPVTPFSNFPLAPVPLDLVVDLAARILESGERGLFQASAADDTTYVALAEDLARRFGFDRALIRPVEAKAETLGFDRLPRYSSLEMEREGAVFGFDAPEAARVVRDVVAAL